jgi:hypothetical protein
MLPTPSTDAVGSSPSTTTLVGVPQSRRVPRRDEDLVNALLRHVELLRHYADRAFNQGDAAFLGEVAGKLRLLVYEHPHSRNNPLLLSIMNKYGIEVLFFIDSPIKGKGGRMDLRTYLSETAFGAKTSRGFVSLSGFELIAAWAQQSGAAHEDWSLDEELARLLNAGVFIGGIHASAATLRAITNTVLAVADGVLSELFENEDDGDA